MNIPIFLSCLSLFFQSYLLIIAIPKLLLTCQVDNQESSFTANHQSHGENELPQEESNPLDDGYKKHESQSINTLILRIHKAD